MKLRLAIATTLLLPSSAFAASSHAVEPAVHNLLRDGVQVSGIRLKEREVTPEAAASSTVRPTFELGQTASHLPNGELWVGLEAQSVHQGGVRAYRLDVDAVQGLMTIFVPAPTRRMVSAASTAAGLASTAMGELGDPYSIDQPVIVAHWGHLDPHWPLQGWPQQREFWFGIQPVNQDGEGPTLLQLLQANEPVLQWPAPNAFDDIGDYELLLDAQW